jgi:hypothetical protein
VSFGVPTDERLAKINKLSKRPLSKEEVFVYPHKMAGDMIIPDRFIQLTPPLLEIFVQNANDGIALLLDHSWAGFGRPKPALPYGRVFEGELSQKEGLIEGETVSFNGSAYIVRGQEKDGISTDSIISDIETGVMFDTSIGWGANKFECSICGNDIRNWRKCEHFPGKIYVVNDETGETKLCWAMAKPPGFLMEDSLVFDGAYPAAGTSLSSLADEGGFENEYGTFVVVDDFKKMPLSTIYGTYNKKGGILTFVKKADYKKAYSFSSGDNQSLKGGEKTMFSEAVLKMFEAFGIEYKEGETKLEDVLNQVGEKWDTIPQVESQEGEIQVYMTQDQVKEKLGQELSAEEVLKLAKDGQDYRQQTIDEAIAMGVKAMGNDFPAETWKSTFASMSIQAIKDVSKTWETQAKNSIPAGRFSSAGDEEKSEIPDDAFKVK